MGKDEELFDALELRIHEKFSLDKCLFFASIPVDNHLSKKNGRSVFLNKATGRMFPGKNNKLRNAEDKIIIELKMQRIQQRISDPISERLWAIFYFYFKKEDFITKAKEISLRLPDLSNLYELPQDCLQKAGVILNDTQIDSHDLSRRLIGPQTKLDIFLLKYNHNL